MEDLRNKYDIILHRAKGSYLEEAPLDIFEHPQNWVLEHKIDGERASLQIGKEKSLLVGRNRQDQLKGVAVAGRFRSMGHKNPPMTKVKSVILDKSMLDGELTETFRTDGHYSKSTEKRIKAGRFIGYTAWGALYYKGKDVRHLSEEERYRLAGLIVARLNKAGYKKIRLDKRVPATHANLISFFNKGLEGAIAKRLGASLPIGHKTNPNWWKLKGDKDRTVDAFIIGVTEKKSGGSGISGVKPKPNGMAATFTMGMLTKKGYVEVGKMGNLPKDVAEKGFKQFKKYKLRVVEMTVSGWNGEAFRLPRFKKWRPDKRDYDCRFEEQVGKKKKEKTNA